MVYDFAVLFWFMQGRDPEKIGTEVPKFLIVNSVIFAFLDCNPGSQINGHPKNFHP